MIPIVKSNKEPVNKEAIWVNVSTNPAIIFIYKGDNWEAIGTDNQTLSEIAQAIQQVQQGITDSNKKIDNTLKKGSLATIDNVSIEAKGNIDLTQNYITQQEWENTSNDLDTRIGQTFTQEQKDLLDSIEEGANVTVIDQALSDSSENPVQNNIIYTEIASNKAEVEQEFKNHTDDYDIHIPTNGNSGQFLQSNGDDTASWINLDLTDLLSYGVAWKANVGDPDLTRIGNPLLHRSLPIQSQIHGCIAQCKTDDGKPKIIYWLDKNDWRFKQTPDILYGITVNVADDGTITIVNSVFSTLRYDKQYIKILTDTPIICQVTELNTENSTATVTPENTVTLETGTYNIELGAVLNGYDGEVKNYVPKFYYKSYDGETDRWVKISQFKLDDSWVESRAILISASQPTILRSVPSDMGYISTLEQNSIVSIFNDNAYCRGGNNDTTWDLDQDEFRRNLGKPVTQMSRASMRASCSKSGNHMLSYNEYKAIFYWLWVIEYATFHCQKTFNPELTSEGYHQGGMSMGVTTLGKQDYYNNYNPITPCGFGREYGNKTYAIPITIVTPTTSGGDPTNRQTQYVTRWRGFNNVFGDIWNNIDGIIIDANAGLEGRNNMNIVYVSNNPDDFNDSDISKYYIAGYEIHSDGYTKEWALGGTAEIIPRTMGGSESLYKCDHHYTGNKNGTLRILLLGACAFYDSMAGLGCFYSDDPVGYVWSPVGLWSSCFC